MIREVMSWKMWVVVHILKSTALERFRERQDLETRSLRSSSSDPGLKAARKYQASVKFTYRDALNDITALSHSHLGAHSTSGGQAKRNWFSRETGIPFCHLAMRTYNLFPFFSLLIASKWELNSAHFLFFHSHWPLYHFPMALTSFLSPQTHHLT